MDRNHEYIADNGKVYKWRLDYEGQPFYCFRGCGVFHEDGKCPKWEKIKERRANDGQQKSTSPLFLSSATYLTPRRVVAIPGAKVGHLAHHIINDTKMFEKAEVLVVAAGEIWIAARWRPPNLLSRNRLKSSQKSSNPWPKPPRRSSSWILSLGHGAPADKGGVQGSQGHLDLLLFASRDKESLGGSRSQGEGDCGD